MDFIFFVLFLCVLCSANNQIRPKPRRISEVFPALYLIFDSRYSRHSWLTWLPLRPLRSLRLRPFGCGSATLWLKRISFCRLNADCFFTGLFREALQRPAQSRILPQLSLPVSGYLRPPISRSRFHAPDRVVPPPESRLCRRHLHCWANLPPLV